jgi:hypothetical protein
MKNTAQNTKAATAENLAAMLVGVARAIGVLDAANGFFNIHADRINAGRLDECVRGIVRGSGLEAAVTATLAAAAKGVQPVAAPATTACPVTVKKLAEKLGVSASTVEADFDSALEDAESRGLLGDTPADRAARRAEEARRQYAEDVRLHPERHEGQAWMESASERDDRPERAPAIQSYGDWMAQQAEINRAVIDVGKTEVDAAREILSRGGLEISPLCTPSDAARKVMAAIAERGYDVAAMEREHIAALRAVDLANKPWIRSGYNLGFELPGRLRVALDLWHSLPWSTWLPANSPEFGAAPHFSDDGDAAHAWMVGEYAQTAEREEAARAREDARRAKREAEQTAALSADNRFAALAALKRGR